MQDPKDSSDPKWDNKWQIQDGLLAAVLQIIRLEKQRITCECIVTHGHRLPREICLDLPISNPDPSYLQVNALIEAVFPKLASYHSKVSFFRCWFHVRSDI